MAKPSRSRDFWLSVLASITGTVLFLLATKLFSGRFIGKTLNFLGNRYTLGSFIVALIVAILVFLVTYLLLKERFENPKVDETVCKSSEPYRGETFLKLRIYLDTRNPSRVDAENIFRWYYLRMFTITLDPNGGNPMQAPGTAILFVLFDHPIAVDTLEVTAVNAILPLHEVKDLGPRHAIIVFSSPLPDLELVVSVKTSPSTAQTK